MTITVEPFGDASSRLRVAYAHRHLCRTVRCDNAVDHCGDHCPRCTEEIDAAKARYDSDEAFARKAASAGWQAIGIVALLFVLIGFAWAISAGWM